MLPRCLFPVTDKTTNSCYDFYEVNACLMEENTMLSNEDEKMIKGWNETTDYRKKYITINKSGY